MARPNPPPQPPGCPPQTQRSKAAKELLGKAKRAILLSGTPMLSRPGVRQLMSTWAGAWAGS